MKRSIRTWIASAFALSLTFAIVAPTASAAGIMPFTAYQSADYIISQDAKTWTGKGEVSWWIDNQYTVYSVSVTEQFNRSVSAKLYRLATWGPDQEVLSAAIPPFYATSGKWWSSSEPFLSYYLNAQYYPKVETTSTAGVKGRVSIQTVQ